MALERDDLDELNKPPRRMRSVQALPLLVAGAEDQALNGKNGNGHHGEQTMAEPTVAEMLLEEMRDIKKLLSTALTEQTKMRVQVDMHETDLRDLKTWRDSLPERAQQRQQQRETAWWQTTNGRINLLMAAIVLVTVVAPYVAAHWH